MPSIPLKHKCLSIILIDGSLFLISSSGLLKNDFFFYFSELGKSDMVLGKKGKRWLFWIGNGPRDEQKIPCYILLFSPII